MIKIRSANINDISSIMKIERESFIKEIQESDKVFRERIEIFSKGFLIFEDEQKNCCGYISTELWSDFSVSDKTNIETLKSKLMVGHSISKTHSNSGTVLYISSFALGKKIRGKGFGKELFKSSLDFLDSQFKIENKILLVNEKWKSAQKIYTDYGFKTFCVIPKIFDDSDGQKSSGLVMIK